MTDKATSEVISDPTFVETSRQIELTPRTIREEPATTAPTLSSGDVEPIESFESGIERTVAWYRDNREWVERARSGAYRDYYERNYGWRVAEGNSRG